MNLVSAVDLPGTENLDVEAMLSLLNQWAKGAAEHVLKSAGLFAKHQSAFKGSLARFRITLIIRYLVQECGIRYNPDQAKTPVFNPPPITDPLASFIHGLLGDKRTGTCATLPVLLTAIGRKLGYPLKLVLAPQHMFCRWDSPTERFNIEMHANGLNSHPDRYYTCWPFQWPPQLHEQERARPFFLQSLTPPQELAHFAFTRGGSLDVAGRFVEALACMRVAQRLWPARIHAVWINHLITKINFPDKKWPHAPCEQTCGREAILRMSKQIGVRIPD